MQISHIFSFWNGNQDHIYSAITAFATLFLFIISVVALTTWKKEKHFDLIIESLAFARECEELIKELRSPLSFVGELTPELKERLDKDGRKYYEYFIYLSRKQHNKDVYERLVKFYFKNWAKEGDKGLMTTFFNTVLQTLRDIESAHQNRSWVQDEDDAELRKKVHKDTRSIITARRDDDEIAPKISGAIAQLEKVYRKQL